MPLKHVLAELQAERSTEAIDGIWVQDTTEIHIKGGKVIICKKEYGEVKLMSDTLVSLIQDGETVYGMLKDFAEISWSDGDVWKRVSPVSRPSSSKGSASSAAKEKPPSEQLPSPALPPAAQAVVPQQQPSAVPMDASGQQQPMMMGMMMTDNGPMMVPMMGGQPGMMGGQMMMGGQPAMMGGQPAMMGGQSAMMGGQPMMQMPQIPQMPQMPQMPQLPQMTPQMPGQSMMPQMMPVGQPAAMMAPQSADASSMMAFDPNAMFAMAVSGGADASAQMLLPSPGLGKHKVDFDWSGAGKKKKKSNEDEPYVLTGYWDDWICPNCTNLNYASRDICNTKCCRAPRPVDSKGHNQKFKWNEATKEWMEDPSVLLQQPAGASESLDDCSDLALPDSMLDPVWRATIDGFLAEWGIDGRAAAIFRSELREVQELAMDKGMGGARNPSGALLGRVRDAKKEVQIMANKDDALEAYVATNNIGMSVKSELYKCSQEVRELAIARDVQWASNPSTALMARIRQAKEQVNKKRDHMASMGVELPEGSSILAGMGMEALEDVAPPEGAEGWGSN